MTNHSPQRRDVYRVVLPAILCLLVAGVRATAQSTLAPESVMTESFDFGEASTMSPDGSLVASFGADRPTELHIKNVHTGIDTVIVRSTDIKADWEVVSGMTFSVNSKLLAFSAGPGRNATGALYTVNLDGSDLRVIASAIQGVHDPAKSFGTSDYDLGIGNPKFSPDDMKIMVDLYISDEKSRLAEGQINHGSDREFVGVLNVKKIDQEPEKIAEGKSLFWSIDGNWIYVIGPNLEFERVEMTTKHIETISDGTDTVTLGKVPGLDAAFVWHRWDKHIKVLSLDRSTIGQRLEDFVAGIPALDAEGRVIDAIRQVKPNQLEVEYEGRSSNAKQSSYHTISKAITF